MSNTNTPLEQHIRPGSRGLPAPVLIRALAVLHYGGTLRKMAEALDVPLSVLSEFPGKKAGGRLGARIEAETGVMR